MSTISEILSESHEREADMLERIVKLSHADKVLALLSSWLDEWDSIVFDDYSYTFIMFHSDGSMAKAVITYAATYGYRVSVEDCGDVMLHEDIESYSGIVEDDAAMLYKLIYGAITY